MQLITRPNGELYMAQKRKSGWSDRPMSAQAIHSDVNALSNRLKEVVP